MNKILLLYFCVVVHCKRHNTAEVNSSSMESELSGVGYPVFSFPFSIATNQYFYGKNLYTRNWTIRKLLTGGKMGKQIDRGNDSWRWTSQFPFAIDGQHYVFGIADPFATWIIQKIHPNGKLNPVSYTFSLSMQMIFGAVFPFFIDGKQYFHARSEEGWYTFELLYGGKCCNLRQSGYPPPYFGLEQRCFPFSVDAKQYFYCNYANLETIGNRNTWFIQELLPGGYVGQITDTDQWNSFYKVQFPFSIEDKLYFYMYNNVDGAWFIRELLNEGKMGKLVDSGYWRSSYLNQFPFSISSRQFFYAKHFYDNSWFIREILATGKMGNVTDSDTWNYGF